MIAAFGGGYSNSNVGGGAGNEKMAFPCSHERRWRNPSSPWTIKAPANFNQSQLWKTCSWLWVTGPPGNRRWGGVCMCVYVCGVCARTPVHIISQCPEPWRSWNTSVAQARFIKNPGYRPAVKIEAAYLLHFVQINLKTCESYSLERLGEEVNNIRLILTSRGGGRTKIQKVSRYRNSGRCSPTVPRWGPGVGEGGTFSCHFPHWLDPGFGVPLGQVALPSAWGFSVAHSIFHPALWASVVSQMLPLPSCFLMAAAEIRFNYGFS